MKRKPAFDMLQCTLCALAYAAGAFLLMWIFTAGFLSSMRAGETAILSISTFLAVLVATLTYLGTYVHLREVPARY